MHQHDQFVDLIKFGWDAHFAALFEPYGAAGLIPGRVVKQLRERCVVATSRGQMSAEVSGRFRHGAEGRSDYPVVGDWVAVRTRDGEPGRDRRRPSPQKRLRAQSGGRADGSPGPGGECRYRFPGHRTRRELQRQPHRALPDRRLGIGRRSRGRFEQGRPETRARCDRQGRRAGHSRGPGRGRQRPGRIQSRRSRSPSRAREDDRDPGAFGRGEIDAHQPSAGRGTPAHGTGSRGRQPGPSYDDPSRAHRPPRRGASHRHSGNAGAPALGGRRKPRPVI